MRSFEWPLFQSLKEEKTLMKFLYSFKNFFSENINLNSCFFLGGPSKHGKSWLLNKCLHQFSQSGARPQAAHMKIQQGMSFEMFLYEFDHKCIEMLCKLAPSYSELADRIGNVMSRFYENILIEQQLYKILKECLESQENPLDSCHTLQLRIAGASDVASDLVGKYEGRDYKETPILDNIDTLVESIKSNYGGDDKLALLSVFYAVMLEKENDRKPLQFYNCGYRDGRESLNFFFDLINDYAGYTELYYDEINMSEEEWKAKVRPMRKNRDDPYLQDNYPHVVFAIEKAERFLEIGDQRAEDWLHALILRLYNGSRYRRHFPVILESSNSYYFGYQIYNKLNLWNLAFPTLHVGGYGFNALSPKLSKIYSQNQLKLITNTFGNCIFQTHLFTEVALRSSQKFSHLLSASTTTLPEFKRIRNIFLNRLNKLYLNHNLGPELDSGEIDFLILHFLKRILKSRTKMIKIQLTIDLPILEEPVVQAFLEEKILYAEKHSGYIFLDQKIFEKLMKEVVEKTKNVVVRKRGSEKMGMLERYRFKRYSRYNPIGFDSIKYGRRSRQLKVSDVIQMNEDQRYELFDHYFKRND
ncbi:unnamed protein product [Moneuplotes crassus]|uniref:Uncharacterized protein n=1 Tax=Euplotes crassus TaxID=5936 RepID=A0AAD1X788_EUPCR|nr:unnamed protein product [Moneuplotes crassus]